MGNRMEDRVLKIPTPETIPRPMIWSPVSNGAVKSTQTSMQPSVLPSAQSSVYHFFFGFPATSDFLWCVEAT
jgi:hypothetical protein